MNWKIETGILLIIQPQVQGYSGKFDIGFGVGELPPCNLPYLTSLENESYLVYLRADQKSFLLHKFWEFSIPIYKLGIINDIHILEVEEDIPLYVRHIPSDFTAEISTISKSGTKVVRELEPMLYMAPIEHLAPLTTWAIKY